MNSLILTLEKLSANAWPAAEVQEVDGWRLRHTEGVTRRANSVWPNKSDSTLSIDEKIDRVERFYTQRDLPPCYQICPAVQPADLVQRLTARGYVSNAKTAVQIATIPTILQRSATVAPSKAYDTQIYMSDHKVDDKDFYKIWYETYCRAEQLGDHSAAIRRKIIERIALQPDVQAGFALLYIENQPATLVLGVVEQEWLGIFNMATLPQYRRLGAARSILNTLVLWAKEQGATQAYLQVMEENRPARALYECLGFETLYHYYYCTSVK